MVAVTENVAEGIAFIEIGDIWTENAPKLLKCLEDYFGKDISGADLPPHGQEVELREAVMSAAPVFRQLHDELDALFQNGYCALMIKRLGLLDYDLDTRYKLLYTLSLMLGYPTATEARGRRVSWDIKPRDLPPGYYATYSEIPEPAEFHTDTQYYINPENYLILYVINPAADGSGETTLCSGYALKKRMLESERGQKAFDILRTTEIPFRIPSLFTQSGKGDEIAVTSATIFGDTPFIRLRLDTINKGLELNPEIDTLELRDALACLWETLDNDLDYVKLPLPADAACFVDNHVALHGRTGFSDMNRHLVRLRVVKEPGYVGN